MLQYIIILLFVGATAFWWKKSRSKILEPPICSGWMPVFGHAYKLLGSEIKLLKTIEDICKECEEKGGIMTIYLGPYKAYAILDPEDSITIMNQCLKKHKFFDFAKPILGDGLFTADVPIWKKNRKLLNPAFSQRVLNGYIDIFNTQAERLVERFRAEAGKSFDHEEILRINSMETICRMWASDPEFEALIKEYVDRLLKILVIVNDRMQKFWLHSDAIYNLTAQKVQQDEELRHMSVMSKLIVKRNREQRKKLSGATDDTNSPRPFIDLILDLADETGCFTDDHIEKEIENIISGARDTTATILTYALTALGSYADVQNKAVDEINRVLGNTDKRVDKDDLNKLEYIEAVLKEVLRIYVVFPVLPRVVDRDVELRNYTIKANSDCFILSHGLNRHKSLWGSDADEFRPERWLDKESLPDPKYFASFGLGRRACIGKTYSLMVMKIVLVHVLRSFHISSDIHNMVQKLSVFVRPAHGHHIKLTDRKS